MTTFGKRENTFKARIKPGTKCDYDHCWRSTWPNCGRKADVDLVFDAEDHGTFFSLVAPGFGVIGGDYGNGSLFVSSIDGLIFENPADKDRVLAGRRAEKEKQLKRAIGEVAKLHQELERLA